MEEEKKCNNLDQEKEISELHELDFSLKYSYSNYIKWMFSERVELIRGQIIEMCAPSVTHQRLLLRIAVKFQQALTGYACEIFLAPFDVRLPKESTLDNDVFTVVQPDLCIVCDHGKIEERGCLGAPNLIVEILSPGNDKKDLNVKYGLYQEFAVKEYIVIDPKRKMIIQHILNENGQYDGKAFSGNKRFTSAFLPGFSLSPDQLFLNEAVMRQN